jgi:hypothetical protein
MSAELELASALNQQPTDADVQRLAEHGDSIHPDFDRSAHGHARVSAGRVEGVRFMLQQVERGEHSTQ